MTLFKAFSSFAKAHGKEINSREVLQLEIGNVILQLKVKRGKSETSKALLKGMSRGRGKHHTRKDTPVFKSGFYYDLQSEHQKGQLGPLSVTKKYLCRKISTLSRCVMARFEICSELFQKQCDGCETNDIFSAQQVLQQS